MTGPFPKNRVKGKAIFLNEREGEKKDKKD